MQTYARRATDPGFSPPSQGRRLTVEAIAPDAAMATATADARRRSQIRHDIKHELGTIILLASVVSSADDIGPASRARVEQILGEARWLDRLLRAYEDTEGGIDDRDWAPAPELLQVDAVATTVVAALRLATPCTLTITAAEAWTHADLLALWRALRNVVDNAIRVAGPTGHVQVSVTSEPDWIVTQIDDDGPGFGAGSSGLASLGLGIVQDFVAEHGGSLEIRRSELGGGCVRIMLRAATPLPSARTWSRKGNDEAAAL